MKIKINQEDCIECGSCWQTCPKVFMENEAGKAAIVKEYRNNGGDTGEIKENLAYCANEGADMCPVGVITLEK